VKIKTKIILNIVFKFKSIALISTEGTSESKRWESKSGIRNRKNIIFTQSVATKQKMSNEKNATSASSTLVARTTA